MDKGLSLFDKRLDKDVPWNIFKDTLKKLDVFRQDYSTEAASLISDLKVKMYDGIDTYFMASENIYEWCGVAIPRLTKYKSLWQGKMDEAKFKTQKSLLLNLLTDGIERMGKAQEKLDASSSSFNVAAGKLLSLSIRLEADFSEKSEYYQTKILEIRKAAGIKGISITLFGLTILAGTSEKKYIPEIKEKMKSLTIYYKDLQKTIAKASSDIDSTKTKMRDEIRVIGQMKSKAEETKIYVEGDIDGALQKIIGAAVDSLIANCNSYRNRHKNDTLK